MKRVRRHRRAGSIRWLKEAELTALRERLPQFDPHDLRSLVNEARLKSPQGDTDGAFMAAFRERNNHQISELLLALNVDSSRPDVWQRAFLRLAVIHHGVGNLEWRPRNPKKNAATWSSEHNMKLLEEMGALKSTRLSERAAVRKLATDRRKQKLFPYRPQRATSVSGEQARREAALWRHWQKLRSRQPILEALLGTWFGRPEPRGSIEAALDSLELDQWLVEIESALKRPVL
jgi:hypothetical protein